VTGRTKKIAFFITLGSCLVAVAIFLNVGWIMAHGRNIALMVLGMVFFAIIIAGFVIYTIFLVREIRRSEQQDSFINAVTHELKTPIASIRLYLETLQSRKVTEEQQKQFYTTMLADADRLRYTVEQVLKAGQAGHDSGAPTSVDMIAIVTESVEISRSRHHLDAERLSFEQPAFTPDAAVLGNADDLVTAVTNLIDNAVKYSHGDPHVRVELDLHDTQTVHVRVQDTGVGIPRDQLKLVFQRFYRVPVRAVREVKGTGLGLFIVRSIAKRHGGRVFAESPGENQGSTFTLELPKAESGKSA
jgi:two-component system sensor histidine kinase SenX3